MSVAHHLPHARFAFKPLSTASIAAKAAKIWEKVTSAIEAPSGNLLVSLGFGAVALYSATMVLSLLTL